MKTCDSCIYFIKMKHWQHSHRKGLCDFTDHSIFDMKKRCEFHKGKRFKREKIND